MMRPPGDEPALYLGRGFTGHEHLRANGLINMNARLYDPALGRFLSPDPWVQMPFSTQNFNRYSYAMNNPLCYVDENGEFFWFAIGAAAVAGAVFNVATHWKQIEAAGGGWKGFWKGASYALVGAAAGAAGTAAAIGMSGLLTTYGISMSLTSSGVMAGAINGAADGLASGFVLGTSNSLLEGYNLGQSLMVGAGEALTGTITGTISGGITGGLHAFSEGADLWKGCRQNITRGSPFTTPDPNVNYPKDETWTYYMGTEKDTGIERYAGITSREPEIRFSEHRRSGTNRAGLVYEILGTVPTKLEARKMEQKLINQYGMMKNGGILYNLRNEINPNLWNKLGIKK